MTTAYAQQILLSSPTQVAGCKLWLDASDPTAYVTSGTTVTQVNDKSGNGYNSTAASGTVSYQVAGFNGLPTFYFNGTGGFRGPTSVTTDTLTAFCVGNGAATSGFNTRFFALGTPTLTSYQNPTTCEPFLRSASGTENITSYRSNTYQSFTPYVLGTNFLATAKYTGASNIMYLNGTGQTPFASAGSFAISQYGFGCEAKNGTSAMTGPISEIVLYDTALTLSEQQYVEGYLAWKWGLQSNLPTDHLYKTNNIWTPVYPLYPGLTRVASSKPLTITQPWPSTPLPRGTTATKQYFIDAPPYSVFNYTSFAPGSNNIETSGIAGLIDNQILLTHNLTLETGSAFFQPKLNIYKSFMTNFTLQFASPAAAGATFVIQNAASNALGLGLNGLGYSNILNSIAIRFATSYVDTRTEVVVPSVFSTDVLVVGSVPNGLAASGDLTTYLKLNPADPTWNFAVSVSYDGTDLSYTITNTTPGGGEGAFYTSNAAYNIPTTIGSSNAWVGFTSATGDTYSEECYISAWNWSNSK